MTVDKSTGEIRDDEHTVDTPKAKRTAPAVADKAVARREMELPPELAPFKNILSPPIVEPGEVLAAVFSVADMAQPDPEFTARSIAAQIIMAATLDEAATQQEVTHAEDILDVPLRLRDVKWLPTDYDEGARCYALITCIRTDTGDETLVSVGGLNVLAFVFKWWHAGMPDYTILIHRADKPTDRGYYPLRAIKAAA